jgi:hypothetical protein
MAITNVASKLESVHPQSLKIDALPDPQPLGTVLEQARKQAGQCFEWALDQAHMEKKEAAMLMGFTDQSVINRWVKGIERIQDDKVEICLPSVYQYYLLNKLQACAGVEVKTQVTLARIA